MPKVTPIKKEQVTLRIDEDILERLAAYAKTARVPKSILAQLAINEYLDKHNAPWPSEPDVEG